MTIVSHARLLGITDNLCKAPRTVSRPGQPVPAADSELMCFVQLQTRGLGSQLSEGPKLILLESDLGGSVPRQAAEAFSGPRFF